MKTLPPGYEIRRAYKNSNGRDVPNGWDVFYRGNWGQRYRLKSEAYDAISEETGMLLGPMTIDDHGVVRQNPKGRNMATKKPSAAQLAARAKFAAAARAGTLRKGAKRKANPLTRVKLKSPSMATKEAPSKRLVKRRKATQKAPEGYYANPLEHTRVKAPAKFEVWTANARGEVVKLLGAFPDKSRAVEYGKAYVESKGVRVAIKGRGL